MSLLPKITLLLCLMTISACGFKPIYAEYESGGVQEYLASVEVTTRNKSRLLEILKAKIDDNFHNYNTKKQYKLVTSLTHSESAVLTDSDGTVSRYRVNIISPYSLIRLKDNKTITTGTIRHSSSYNLSEDADYATFIGQQDALKRVVKELAEDYKTRISVFFMQNKG